MSDVGSTLRGLESVEECADTPPSCFYGSLVCLADQPFDLCKHHLDGIEVRAVGRKKEDVGAGISYGFANGVALVAAQVVEDDDVLWRQGWDQSLLDPGREDGAVDWAVEDERRDNTIMPQAGQEGQRLPVAMGDFVQIGLPALTPAMCPSHVGFHVSVFRWPGA